MVLPLTSPVAYARVTLPMFIAPIRPPTAFVLPVTVPEAKASATAPSTR